MSVRTIVGKLGSGPLVGPVVGYLERIRAGDYASDRLDWLSFRTS